MLSWMVEEKKYGPLHGMIFNRTATSRPSSMEQLCTNIISKAFPISNLSSWNRCSKKTHRHSSLPHVAQVLPFHPASFLSDYLIAGLNKTLNSGFRHKVFTSLSLSQSTSVLSSSQSNSHTSRARTILISM
jgi:hypothetical protein